MPQKSTLFAMLFIYTIVNCCASKLNSVKKTTLQDTNPKLLFLNYSISKNSNGESTVTFVDKKIVDGKLKNRGGKYSNTGRVGDLKCTQLNSNSKEINSVYIKNPLYKTFEFVNDSLRFEKKTLALNNAPFLFRVQLNPQTRFIEISEVVDTLLYSKTLHSIKLN